MFGRTPPPQSLDLLSGTCQQLYSFFLTSQDSVKKHKTSSFLLFNLKSGRVYRLHEGRDKKSSGADNHPLVGHLPWADSSLNCRGKNMRRVPAYFFLIDWHQLFKIRIYLYLAAPVLVAAHRIFCCGVQILSCGLWQSSYLTRDQSHPPYVGSIES